MVHEENLSNMQLSPEYLNFLELHEKQFKSFQVPQHYWPTVYEKLTKAIFNVSPYFQLAKVEYDEEKDPEDPAYIIQVANEEGIKKDDRDHIYLIDHAWSFQMFSTFWSSLESHEGKEANLNRMCNMMGIDISLDEDRKLDKIYDLIWKYTQTYSVLSTDTNEHVPIWYVMDEVGSAIIHSDNPNVRAVPFLHIPQGTTYTLIFPIRDLEFGDFLSRDFAEGNTNEDLRKILLLPWRPVSFLDINYLQTEPDKEYFLSGHVEESLPNNETTLDLKNKLKVYTEYELIKNNLKDDRFEITDNETEANILWLTRHFKEFADLRVDQIVNQFPFEYVITIKDLLNIVCRRKCRSGHYPSWLPITYNLKTEMDKFISYYQYCQNDEIDNHWIIKPWNLARGMHTYITKNLDHIIKLSTVWPPKLAQKYIENPVLFLRPEIGKVKFDLRYVILLKSVQPLKLYVYRNFFIRFANKTFELKKLHEYERHFTVMNYENPEQLKHMLCSEFLEHWSEQYEAYKWDEIEVNIFEMLREVFEAAVEKPPPLGIAHSTGSRALYAADIMLEWDKDKMQPKLLEINWTPDCKRACDYYPDFYDKIFGLLFLNEEHDIFKDI